MCFILFADTIRRMNKEVSPERAVPGDDKLKVTAVRKESAEQAASGPRTFPARINSILPPLANPRLLWLPSATLVIKKECGY